MWPTGLIGDVSCPDTDPAPLAVFQSRPEPDCVPTVAVLWVSLDILRWRTHRAPAKTLLYHAPFSLRSSVPYSNFLKSVDSIIGTSGERREGLFSDKKGVSPTRSQSRSARTWKVRWLKPVGYRSQNAPGGFL